MTPRQIHLVRESFAWVAPIAPQAAAMFYDRVFERAPSVASMFRGDLVVQGQRLMAMIALAVQMLDQPEQLDRALAQLGQRHEGYGVKPAHYDVVGGALLDTLSAGLGAAFSPEHRAAWAALYMHVSRTMQQPAMAG